MTNRERATQRRRQLTFALKLSERVAEVAHYRRELAQWWPHSDPRPRWRERWNVQGADADAFGTGEWPGVEWGDGRTLRDEARALAFAFHTESAITMTREAFEHGYAERSNLTVDQLRALGRIVRPCRCGVDGCAGWQSVSREIAEQNDREWPQWGGREGG